MPPKICIWLTFNRPRLFNLESFFSPQILFQFEPTCLQATSPVSLLGWVGSPLVPLWLPSDPTVNKKLHVAAAVVAELRAERYIRRHITA